MKEMDTTGLSNDDCDVSLAIIEAFMSLLGAVAWCVLTRADVNIYIQSLQRHGSKPKASHWRKLILLGRYLKRHKIGLQYGRVQRPFRLVAFSVAAFKAQMDESSA